jgi:hypothetical protein
MNAEFTDKERQLLDRLLANRATFARDEAERKRAERLYRRGWLRHGRHHTARYFVLSYKATQHFGIHRMYSRLPGYTALVRSLGITATCDQFSYERLSAW